MFIAAQQLGMTTIESKDITSAGDPPGNAKPQKLTDVGIGIDPVAHENEPTAVANPKDKKKLVAGSHRYPVAGQTRCVAYSSANNGATWTGGILLPQLSGECSDPVMAYAPDGSRVYAAYMDINGANWDILVSHSDDNGATWSPPVIALDGDSATFIYDKPWIDTHELDASQSNWVYVTATQFSIIGTPDPIAFARSGNKGASFSVAPTLFDSALFPVVVQGSHPAGGPGGDVIVAWYNSDTDGWLAGGFKVQASRSSDHGASFGPIVTAATDSFELSYWLGPNAFYHRWWGGMFPSVKIDAKGTAHIVYTHSPVDQNTGAGFSSNESGDIRYVTETSGTWSSPLTISDDTTGVAQGYPALRVGNGDQLHAAWEDHRLSPVVPTVFPNSSNLYYDNFYSRMVPGAAGWTTNFRVSDTSSISDYLFIGDYTDIAVNNTTTFSIWTDRRHQGSIFAPEDNVFGSRIISGGGTP